MSCERTFYLLGLNSFLTDLTPSSVITQQVVKNACLAPSDSPEYHGPVHAVVGMAGQGLSHNRTRIFFFFD